MTAIQLMPEIADLLNSCEHRAKFKRPAGSALAFAPSEWRFHDSGIVCPGRFARQSGALRTARPTR